MENILTVEEIINALKSGEHYSLACSMYEEYYWYKDGKFYYSSENGIEYPKTREISETLVRKSFGEALADKDNYDVWQGI